MNPIKLISLIPTETDVTSYYRAHGPLQGLVRKDVITVSDPYINSKDHSWKSLGYYDALFMQRPFVPKHLELAKMAKEHEKLPLWLDYDDLLFCVPSDNPTFATYSDPKNHAAMRGLLEMADVVTVSTPALKAALQLRVNGAKPLAKRVYVVPNALDQRRWDSPRTSGKKKLIVWRGTPTHQRDLMTYTPQIIETMKKNPDWTLAFYGFSPWWIMEKLDNVVSVPPLPPFEFRDLLCKSEPAIMIVPLHDSQFNRCKSNIAWIEGTYAGAAVIAPDWTEWRRPGMVTYKNPDDFGIALQMVIDNADLRDKCRKQSMNEIIDTLLLQQVNRLREDILEALVGRKEWPEHHLFSREEEKSLFGADPLSRADDSLVELE